MITKLLDTWFQCLTSEKSDSNFQTWGVLCSEKPSEALQQVCGGVLTITQWEAAD